MLRIMTVQEVKYLTSQ